MKAGAAGAAALALVVGCDALGEQIGTGDGGPEPGSPEAFAEAGVIAHEVLAPLDLLGYRHPPGTVGLDSVLLADAAQRASELPRLHNMLVARHGEVLVERDFRGPAPDRPTNIKSASKSVLSALVGLAIEDGYLEGPDQLVFPFFEDYLRDAHPDDPRRRISVEHLLSMSSGLQSTSSRNYGRWVASPDWVAHALTRPMRSEPGERMEYSTGSTHLLSAVLTHATGTSTHAYARERLAEPLGIELPPWLRDPQGIYFGGNEMALSARGLLRFGELYRNGGMLDGRRILPREWVEESWRVRVRSPRRRSNGYALGWWARRSGVHQVRFAWGYGGQFLFVVPALELTVVFTSDPVSPREGPHNSRLHELLDDWLVPAAEIGAVSRPGVGGDAGAGSRAEPGAEAAATRARPRGEVDAGEAGG